MAPIFKVETMVVATSTLEKDERFGEIFEDFTQVIRKENAFQELSDEEKTAAEKVFDKLSGIRFRSLADFKETTALMLKEIEPNLVSYIEIALNKAKNKLNQKKGVLVIYTGGTIGSAPKDLSDPESPQIVKPWEDLKYAVPHLDKMGFPIDAISFVEPLDSCNVGPNHWRTMAMLIKQHYNDYEGFVLLHGTDTMVHTGSALGIMLQDLSKPVVITGSQLAGIVNPRNDAHQNFLTALTLANPVASGVPTIPEVIIVFGSQIIRGCRAKKMDAAGYDGFRSPNISALGTAGDIIEIDTKHVRPPSEREQIAVLDKLDTNVITIDVFPGIQNSDMVKRQLEDPNLRGVILRSYGAGNVPTVPRFLDPLEAIADKVVIVNVTQCPKGTVEQGLYETSQIVLDRGIIGGFDITPEAALCKLMILLGEYGDDIDKVKELMQKSIAGEQSYSVYTSCFSQGHELGKDKKRFDFNSVDLESVSGGEIQNAMLRFYNAKLDLGANERVNFPIYIDLGSDPMDPTSKKFIKSFVKAKSEDAGLMGPAKAGESLSFDISHIKEHLYSRDVTGPLKRNTKVSFTIGLDQDDASFSWDRMDLLIFTYDK